MVRARKTPNRTRTPTAAAPASDPPRSIGIALGALVILAPTLARSPQSGDGAEIVAAALRGGVLHPTGFPLQAWIDRLIVRVPGLEPALAISTLGLAAHAAAGYCIAETLRLLGVSGSGRVLGAAAFLLFPPTWALAVEPEVFSLAHLLIAASILLAVRLASREPETRWRTPAGLGVLAALGAAQHAIALTAVAAWASSARSCLRAGPRRAARALTLLAALALPVTAFYLSLPLLRTSSHWPDWGSLHTPSDIARHAFRMEYGTFSLSAAAGAADSGLEVWLRDAWHWWSVASLLFAIGLFRIWGRRWRQAALPVLGTGLAGLAVLARARLPEHSVNDAVLEHLQGPMAITGGVLIGLGFQDARERLPSARRILDAGALLGVALWLVLGWPVADTSHDRTLDLYARGIASELPSNAMYVTEGDVEAFLGVPTSEGVRYPITIPMSTYPWYVHDVAPRLDSRLRGRESSLENWDAFVETGVASGLEFASSSPSLISTSSGTPELRGLIYVASPRSNAELTPLSVKAAVDLAPLAEQLPILPARGHAFSRFYARRFSRAFAGAGEALRGRGAADLASQADSIAAEIADGRDPTSRLSLLRRWVSSCRAAGIE